VGKKRESVSRKRRKSTCGKTRTRRIRAWIQGETLRKKREIIREARRILEYTADNHDIAASVYNMSGAMLALKWVLGEGPSPVDRISAIDKKKRAERKRNKKCIQQ